MQEFGEILDLLAKGEYVSGEDLAAKLGITRAAVWKQLKTLRELGYEITASSRKGYLLLARPDRLYPWEVEKELNTKIMGQRIEYYEQIPSTNRRAKELLTESPVEGTLIIAEEQTAGRGRLGRNWFSPPGAALYSTVILQPKLPPNDLPKLTLVAAVALSKTIERELEQRPLVKWPNDLYLKGRKISGILTELSGELGRLEYLLLGVGVNVNQSPEDFPVEIREKAGSLRSILGRKEKISRLGLLRSYLQILEEEYLNALQKGFAESLAYCRRYSATLGRRVEVTDGERTYKGRALMIEEDGSLILEAESGEKIKVISGDVNLVDPDAQTGL